MSLEQLIEELTRILGERQAFPHADALLINDDGTTRVITIVETRGGEVVLS